MAMVTRGIEMGIYRRWLPRQQGLRAMLSQHGVVNSISCKGHCGGHAIMARFWFNLRRERR
jgi:hypothetical protein